MKSGRSAASPPLPFSARVLQRDERSSDDAPAGCPRIHGASSRHCCCRRRAARRRGGGALRRLRDPARIRNDHRGHRRRRPRARRCGRAPRAAEPRGRARAGDVRRRGEGVPVHRLPARRPIGLGRRRRGGLGRDQRLRSRTRRAAHREPPVRRRRPAEDVRLSVRHPCCRRADRPRGRPPGRRGGPASHRPAGRRRPGAGGSKARPRGGVDRDRRVARVARARRPGLAADRPRGADDDHRRARRGAARIPRRHLCARHAPCRGPDRGAVAGSDRRAGAASERRRHRASPCPDARRTACWRASRRT